MQNVGMMKLTAAVVGTLMSPLIAQAQDAEPWSANLAITSTYVSRGFDQSWGRPALQGGVDVAAANGWYAGTWMSTISPYFVEDGHIEWDLYGGYAGSYGVVQYRAGLYYYRYPGAEMNTTGTPYDYGEAILALEWRQWSVSYATTVTRDYFGFNSKTLGIGTGLHSRGSAYFALERTFNVGSGVSLSVHYGNQRVRNFDAFSWQDASVTLKRTFAGIDLTVGYARAWNGAGMYKHYTTGIPDSRGRTHVSNPIDGTTFVTVGWTF